MWHLHPDPIAGEGFAVGFARHARGPLSSFRRRCRSARLSVDAGRQHRPSANRRQELSQATIRAGPVRRCCATAADSTNSPIFQTAATSFGNARRYAEGRTFPWNLLSPCRIKTAGPRKIMEPYMGMAGHAEFVRSDLSVFAHVHPAGSVSMAALGTGAGWTRQRWRPPSTTTISMPMPMAMSMPMSDAGPLPPEVRFPYGFPQAGDYRIFVQIKRGRSRRNRSVRRSCAIARGVQVPLWLNPSHPPG